MSVTSTSSTQFSSSEASGYTPWHVTQGWTWNAHNFEFPAQKITNGKTNLDFREGDPLCRVLDEHLVDQVLQLRRDGGRLEG